jgi:hypothetical protein
MREVADAERIHRFMRVLGTEVQVAARIYFTGGATAVLMGWRASTIDVDIKIVPDADLVLRAIPRLKEDLQINIELASPADFIPVRPGWEDRSAFIAQEGCIIFHHFDLVAQALAKIERGHRQDVEDVGELLARGLVDRARVWNDFERIQPALYRYPAVDPASFRRALEAIVGPQPSLGA